MSTRARTAIVGVGATEQGEIPGEPADAIGVRAALLALADAGIGKHQVDGLITCKPPRAGGRRTGVDEDLGRMLGINPAFSSTLEYGACGFSLQLAAMAIESGLAHTVLLIYGNNQRSAKASFSTATTPDAEYSRSIGFVHIAGPAAMAARRHMHLYGTTEEQLGWVSVAQREWAQMNPLAIFKKPMTIDDYLASPYLVAPLRRADLTMISDGGAAIVLTRADRVGEFQAKPIYLAGMAQRTALYPAAFDDYLMRPWIGEVAKDLYRSAGIGPSDVDVAFLQDATSVWVLQMLEWYGFCAVGEAGPFLADGHTRPGGSLPVNTHGGQLSESYMWNWLHLYEAVRQMRGQCGERQVPRADVVLHAQTHDFIKGAAALLSTEAQL